MNKLDQFTHAWIGREYLPSDTDEGIVYLFLEKPTRGYFGNKHYFWRVSDPSLKIRFPAGIAYHMNIDRGSLHPLLKPMETIRKGFSNG